jgi:hypothetical protein
MKSFAFYQIIIFVLAAVLFLRTLLLFIKRRKTFRELLLALFIWGNIGLIGLYPNITKLVAKLTGFQEGINALFVVCIIILFYVVLGLLLKFDKMENSITKLVRQQALKDLKEDTDKLEDYNNLKLINGN